MGNQQCDAAIVKSSTEGTDLILERADVRKKLPDAVSDNVTLNASDAFCLAGFAEEDMDDGWKGHWLRRGSA